MFSSIAHLIKSYLIKVVGGEEEAAQSVNIRNRDAAEKGKGEVRPLQTILQQMLRLKSERRNDNALI
jgi:threonyl-tRNA synthetase